MTFSRFSCPSLICCHTWTSFCAPLRVSCGFWQSRQSPFLHLILPHYHSNLGPLRVVRGGVPNSARSDIRSYFEVYIERPKLSYLLLASSLLIEPTMIVFPFACLVSCSLSISPSLRIVAVEEVFLLSITTVDACIYMSVG